MRRFSIGKTDCPHGCYVVIKGSRIKGWIHRAGWFKWEAMSPRTLSCPGPVMFRTKRGAARYLVGT